MGDLCPQLISVLCNQPCCVLFLPCQLPGSGLGLPHARAAGIGFVFAHRSPALIFSLPGGRDPAAPLMLEINFVSRYSSLGEQRGAVCVMNSRRNTISLSLSIVSSGAVTCCPGPAAGRGALLVAQSTQP